MAMGTKDGIGNTLLAKNQAAQGNGPANPLAGAGEELRRQHPHKTGHGERPVALQHMKGGAPMHGKNPGGGSI